MNVEVYTSFSEDDTSHLGVEFSARLVPGDVVACRGDLGAGKTEFIKGICDGLEVQEIVSSPTYTIVNQYSGEDRRGTRIPIYHIDLYRIGNPSELVEIGMEEIFVDPTAIKLIEWAENAASMLPAGRYEIVFTALDDENSRKIEIVHYDEPVLASGGNGGISAGWLRRNSPRSPLG